MKKIELEEARSGADLILDTLLELGISTIFGYPGGAVLPLYDAIYKNDKINHILSRHEQGSLHEAEGYAKSTGKLGVALVTSGPGATNAITGIADAMSDSVPLLVFTGQVATPGIGKDAFQEADIVGITMPITKHNYLVQDIRDLPRIIKEAYFIASTGRPGPVLIDIPKDVQTEKISMTEYNKLYEVPIHLEGYDPTYKGHQGQIKKAATLIKNAKRPLIIAGAGVLKSGAMDELKELAEKAQIPVTNTLVGLGSFPGNHELALGMVGMHGSVAANNSTEEADLVIAAGIRFHDRITGHPDFFCKKAKIIHIDIDPAEIDKNVTINVPIVGDLKRVLSELNTLVEPTTHEAWIGQIREWQAEYPMVIPESKDGVLHPQYVLSELNKIAKEDAVIVTDVGQHQMWAAQFLTHKKPHTIVTSGGAGTMGYGLPAAIGAQVGAPHKQVILVVGDGGFQMTFEELMMVRQYNLPIKIVIINNGYLGMVRQWQQIFNDRRYSYVDLETSPDFLKLADAFDLKAARIDNVEDFNKEFKSFITSDESIILDCRVAREDNVLPMIPAGGTVSGMMGKKGVL